MKSYGIVDVLLRVQGGLSRTLVAVVMLAGMLPVMAYAAEVYDADDLSDGGIKHGDVTFSGSVRNVLILTDTDPPIMETYTLGGAFLDDYEGNVEDGIAVFRFNSLHVGNDLGTPAYGGNPALPSRIRPYGNRPLVISTTETLYLGTRIVASNGILIGAQKVTMQLFRSGSTQRLECLAYVDLVLS